METPYIDPNLYHGRPEDCANRLQVEQDTYALLDRLSVPYDRVDHDHLDTMEACEAVAELLGTSLCKNLLLCNSQKTCYHLLLLPGEKKFQTKVFSKAIGSARLSFATPEAMEELLHLTPGSVSVLGLQYDTDNRVNLYIDRELLSQSYLGCHPCINTSSLCLSMQDVLEKLLPALHHTPTVVDLPVVE